MRPPSTHLLDHYAAEVPMLEGAKGWVLLGENMGKFDVELVQLRHFL